MSTRNPETLTACDPGTGKGYPSGSVAAQVAIESLTQLWDALGATDQTEAVAKVQALRDGYRAAHRSMVDTWRQAALEGGLTLNPADRLPPVACPLLIEVDGRLLLAERTRFIESKGHDMAYQLPTGEILHGRYRWTYP